MTNPGVTLQTALLPAFEETNPAWGFELGMMLPLGALAMGVFPSELAAAAESDREQD